MPKRKRKPWTLADNLYQPKAKAVRYLVDPLPTYYEVSGRFGIAWDYLHEGLSRRAGYDPETMAEIRKLGGIKALVKRMCPTLSEDRLMRVVANVESICHAKQRELDGPDPLHRAKAWTKKQKRTKRSALAKLKELLKN